MTAAELYRAGRLDEAVRTLSAELRLHPNDRQRRTFLFELLCVNGAFDRAEQQLAILEEGDRSVQLGTLLYRAALRAERLRQERFLGPVLTPPGGNGATGSRGCLNGDPFADLRDADARIGAGLEIFAGGNYLWLPFAHLERVAIAVPRRVRDLLWAPATIQTAAGFKHTDLGEVLLPVLTPLAYQKEAEEVRLGRITAWEEDAEGSPVPAGQKLLLMDGKEIPFLEVREIVFGEKAA